jgi:hypothetical protein
MTDPHHTGPPGPPDDSDTVDEFVERRLTQERLNNIWDRLQGTSSRGGQTVTTYGWIKFVGDCWVTLRVTRVLHKLGLAVIVVAAITIAVLLFRKGDLVSRTPAGWPSVSGMRLPDTLRLRLEQQTASLEGAAYILAGAFGKKLSNGTNPTTMEIALAGRTPEGMSVTFKGILMLSNAPGVVAIRGRRGFIGALLTGELSVGTNAVTVSQPYLPQ